MTTFQLTQLIQRLPVPPPHLFDHPRVQGALGDSPEVTQLLSQEDLEEVQTNALGLPMMFHLSLALEGEEAWLIPQEAQLTITGQHILVKRQVAKGVSRSGGHSTTTSSRSTGCSSALMVATLRTTYRG